MTAHKKKSSHKKTAESSRFKKGIKITLAAFVILAVAVFATERKQLPESLRDHQAAKTVYSLRDKAVAEMRDLVTTENKPLNITAEKKQKPEPGYTEKDRDSLDDLLREEGVAKQ
jgi:hypothetical protein